MTSATTQDALAELALAFGEGSGSRSVVLTVIDGPQHAEHKSTQQFPAASLAKLLIAECLIHEGVDLGAPVRVADLHATRYPSVKTIFDPDRVLSVGEVLALALVSSDNACADYLLDLLGHHRVNQRALAVGMVATTITTGFRDHEFASSKPSLTTAADVARMLLHLHAHREHEGYRRIWHALQNALYNTRIPGLLPDEIVVAHKTGSLTGVVHDAGIVLIPDTPLLLVVLTQNAHELAVDTNRAIADFARAAYDCVVK